MCVRQLSFTDFNSFVDDFSTCAHFCFTIHCDVFIDFFFRRRRDSTIIYYRESTAITICIQTCMICRNWQCGWWWRWWWWSQFAFNKKKMSISKPFSTIESMTQQTDNFSFFSFHFVLLFLIDSQSRTNTHKICKENNIH